jgi:hypothetical protein
MTMHTHTKGPWKVGEDNLGYPVVTHRNGGICRIDDTDEGEANANARLIAAAPELLESCNEALHELRIRCGYTGNEHCYQTLQAAIAAAEGKGTP